MQDFKKLIVWQKAHQLILKTYVLTKTFPKDELYGLISQIKRCSSSIPSNIAEGCGRFSTKDTAHFFQMALGSAHETEYRLILAKDLSFINEEEFVELNSLVNEVKAMLLALIKRAGLEL